MSEKAFQYRLLNDDPNPIDTFRNRGELFAHVVQDTAERIFANTPHRLSLYSVTDTADRFRKRVRGIQSILEIEHFDYPLEFETGNARELFVSALRGVRVELATKKDLEGYREIIHEETIFTGILLETKIPDETSDAVKPQQRLIGLRTR